MLEPPSLLVRTKPDKIVVITWVTLQVFAFGYCISAWRLAHDCVTSKSAVSGEPINIAATAFGMRVKCASMSAALFCCAGLVLSCLAGLGREQMWYGVL